ncbi:MAG TPA: efflux RND transporter periplasmic adaptor subunit, partial [Opitutus sp.]|nr:efflux RND transporter periplasmic adaptor subunit [Opitutus sp.]
MKKILIAAAVIVAALLVLNNVLRPKARVVSVKKDIAVNSVPGSVTVRAEYASEVKSETGGRVVEGALQPGQKVAKGEMLVRLDPTDLELAIEKMEQDYAAAKQRLEIGTSTKVELAAANENLENLVRLTDKGLYAPAELEKQRRSVKEIERRLALEQVGNDQTLAAQENALKVSRRQLAKMTIVAPFEGVISEVFARPGDLIGGGAPIAVLISTSRTVEARISEENFAGLQPGQKAHVRFLGYGGWQYEAVVTRILPTADPSTQRHVVYLDVKIEPEKLVPGMTGEVAIIVGQRQSETIIP